MQISIKQLKNDGTLDYFLARLVDDPERNAFQSCYKNMGENKEVTEWWGDICYRTLPRFPSPEPPPNAIAESLKRMMKDGANHDPSAASHADTLVGRHYLWKTLVKYYYAVDWLIDAVKTDKFVLDRKLSDEISDETSEKCDEVVYGDLENIYWDLMSIGENIRKNNIKTSPTLRLALLGALDSANENDHIPPQSAVKVFSEKNIEWSEMTIVRISDGEVMGVSDLNNDADMLKRFQDTNREKLHKIFGISKKKMLAIRPTILTERKIVTEKLDDSTMYMYRGLITRRIGNEVWWEPAALQEYVTFAPDLKPLCDYLGIGAVNDVPIIRISLENEYKKYNPGE